MLTPQQLINRLNEGIAHHKAGRLDRAEAIYKQLAPLAPRCALLFDVWGQVADRQGRVADAVRLYAQALRLDERYVDVATRLAAVHIAASRAPEAEKVLRRLVQHDDKSAAGWSALGYALKVQGRLDDALACYDRAVKIDPKFVPGWLNYALTLGMSGRNFQALQCQQRVLEMDPQSAAARYGMAQSLHKIYRLEEAVVEYDAYIAKQPGDLEARSYRLFALQNLCRTREQLFAEHLAYGKAVGTGPATVPGHDLSPERRLRVAIHSPDLRTHSCAYFLEPLISHLDPADIELYLYHDHFGVDEMSQRLRKHAAVWRNFVGQPHQLVEKTMRADKPDILIDLTGHIGNVIRLPVFAKRIAPVQITYLGYPDTTGVPAMDFRFTDPIADPGGEADPYATEKLVRFAPVAWAYQPPVEAPEIAPLPKEAKGSVTFGCFNSPTKFTTPLFTAWGRLLNAVPHSRLLLKARDFEEAPVRDHMLGWMARCGIPVDRVDLLPRTSGVREHLGHYAQMDIALDTFPYNGTTTTCEALWMGRPVVTLRGDRHAARVGASLLTAIGSPDWITTDVDAYVATAAALARSPDIGARAAGLRDAMRQSPLMDYRAQSARFAAALRACWTEKCRALTEQTVCA